MVIFSYGNSVCRTTTRKNAFVACGDKLTYCLQNSFNLITLTIYIKTFGVHQAYDFSEKIVTGGVVSSVLTEESSD